MQIFGMSMSRSLRAVWAAYEAGLDFEYIEVEYGKTEQNGSLSDNYRGLNPQGKVPTMVDGEVVITESTAILNYLANKTPEAKLIPVDGSAERAKYDEICSFIVTELEQPLWTTGKHRFALPEEYRVSDEIHNTTAFEFEKAQGALLRLKGNSEFAVGDHFTMADVLLAHTIAWARKFEFKVDDSLLAYKEEMMKRPAFGLAFKKIGK